MSSATAEGADHPAAGASPVPGPPLAGRRPSGQRQRRAVTPWLLLLLLVPLATAAGYWLRRTPAVVAFDAELVDFESVRLGERVERRLDIRNAGQASLAVTAVAVAGAAAGEFQLVDAEACTSRRLGAGDSCSLRVVFAPTVSGPSRANLEVASDGLGGSRAVPLLGRAVAPELKVGPARLDFGEQVVGQLGERLELRLENRGSAPLRVASVDLDGLAAADFVRFSDGCARVQLGPGDACAVGFEFVPTTAGERLARVRIDSDAAAVGELPRLLGRGLSRRGLLEMVPAALDFGTARVGHAGETRPVTLTNSGHGPLRLVDVRLVPAAEGQPATGSFRVDAADCAGELGPGESCRLGVLFEPAAEGELAALVEVEHGEGEVGRMPLAGRAVAPGLRLGATDQLGLGEVTVGQSGAGQGFELSNPGSAPLALGPFEVVGDDAAAFDLDSDCTERLRPAASCRVEVSFRPLRDGPHRAELQLGHDAGGGPARLTVNGLGVSGRLDVSPKALDFGSVRLGSRRDIELLLTNVGRAPLALGRLRLTGAVDGDFRLRGDCAGKALAPGAACHLTVRFVPRVAGARRARLEIRHDAADEPWSVVAAGLALP